MKKNFRRAMAAVMAAALALSLAGTAAEADAAKKKKIKLASKTVTVKAKKSKTVKIKNVKAKQVKKLTVKSASKKIATAKAKGKTAVKVTGKKAGKSTKVKITLKLKGQKKATKLTLKVKVAKAKPVPPAVTNAPAPATQAPNVPSTKAPDAPAASQPPQGGEASQAPATGKPSAKPQPSKAPAVVPTWTPDPKKEVSEITLHYTKDETRSFEVTNEEGTKSYAPKMIKFTDADDYPEGDAIDVRYYKKVIVKYEGKKFEKDGGWDNGGKATLNTTNEDLGQSAYTNGLFMKYLHDLTTAEVNAYKDGVYTVEYDISEATLDPEGGWEFPDVGEIDCVSVQMGNEENYEGFKLQTIEFKEPIQTGTTTPTADPNATADPDKTADPNATADPDKTTAPTVAPTATPKVTAKFANGQIEEKGETTITVTTDKGTVKTVRFAAVKADVADVNNTNPAAIKVTGKKEGTTEIKGSVTLTIDGKDVVIDNVSAGTLTVVPKGTPIVEAEVESAEIEMIAGTTGKVKVKNVTVTVSGEADPDANVTYAWTIDPETVAKISGTTAEATATVTAEAKGTAKATVTITATTKDGKSSQPLKKEVTVTVYDALTVDTAAIEYAANDVAINGTVAPKALLGKTVKTNGTIAEVTWAIVETAGVEKAETETASIDAKTGVVTGKKAGTVKVKATVKVTGELNQKETVVVEGTVTVNNNRMLSLKNENVTKEGSVFASDFSGEPWAGQPVENEDGSITWFTDTTWGGGGLNFYLNPDKSHFDLTKFSKIKVTLSVSQSEEASRQVYLGLVCDGKKAPSWNPSADPVNVALDAKPEAYPTLKGNGEDDTIEVDLTQEYTIPQDSDLAENCGVVFVRVKYNANGKPEGTRSTITVKSIELVAKN